MSSQRSVFQRAMDALIKSRMAHAQAEINRYHHLYEEANKPPFIQDQGH